MQAERLGQEQKRGEEGVVIPPVSPPTQPEVAPDWLRDRRAQVTFASRAERGRADPRTLRRAPRAAVSRGVPHPGPHRPTPALRQLRQAEDPQHQHGLLHRKLECPGGRAPSLVWAKGSREPPGG